MSTPVTLETMQVAIEQMRPELPALLGTDYTAFAEELDSYLAMGSINRLLDLFGRYPSAHHRLLDAISLPEEETTKGIRLPGDEEISPIGYPGIPWPLLYYRCEDGPHVVTQPEVEERDAPGRAVCPEHHIAMNVINSQDVKTAIEQWRSELPGLLGEKYLAFIEKLNSAVQGWSTDQLVKLLNAYPVGKQRLLQKLV